MTNRTTNDAGIPAPSDEHSMTSGEQGPILRQNPYLVQKMAQFNRERVPERVVHAKGAGAHGFFECTEDMSDFTRMLPFHKGARHDVFMRMSTVAGEQGYSKAAQVYSYNKDGSMRYSNPGDPVYAPNSCGGPQADTDTAEKHTR